MKTAANIYIFNLALADALVLATLPFQGTDAILGFWPFGLAVYIAVYHPMPSLTVRTPLRAKLINVAVWIPVVIISICYGLMVRRLRSVRLLYGSREKDQNLRRIT
ncbi:hypothetical protein cypCar_00033310 [Cyprinus carpio]|nr:hypothetical protein cypCar_00033310 [Cyprinus carpio]